MSFADLGLSEELLNAIADSGYDEPTPIQNAAIPSVLMGKDLIGIAQTGTGKTAGFVLPMIDILHEGRSRARMPRSLILEPTRELAMQVAENFEKYGKYHPLSMALLMGGVQMGDQGKALEKGVDVLIATPGRLMDLFGRGKIMLTDCKLLVLDEADRMLDMGFIPDVEGVSHVINFDVPWQPDDYIHRIGRTGRAGMTGIAITLAAREDGEAVGRIEKLIGHKIPRGADAVADEPPAPEKSGRPKPAE